MLNTSRALKWNHTFRNLNFNARQKLSKSRLSDHSLEIERGRYQRPYLKPEERKCPFRPDKIEDEYHFLIECAMYRDKRQAFLNSINYKSYSYTNQNNNIHGSL